MYRRFCYRGVSGRPWSSSTKQTSCTNRLPMTQSMITTSSRSSSPGMVRVTKGYGAKKHEAELDSTLARIIGSDWGDRSRQPVSLPMRIYWVMFTVVLVNGLYTYFTGEDESFLVEKLKKKAEEKMGRNDSQEETNEFVAIDDGNQKGSSAAVKTISAQCGEGEVVVMTQSTIPSSSVGTSCTIPFIVPGRSLQTNARQLESKEELEQQLAQLRRNQERLEKQICSSEGTAKDELEHQVRMIDIQKEQVKLQITNVCDNLKQHGTV